jgi:lipopolysaccharide/colanic/teichoic acid biosynthesis glycosyltransferase
LKRLIELSVSLVLLIVLAPLILIISLLVIVNLGRPIFFIQRRSGKNSSEFKLYKFRTMSLAMYSDGTLLPDEKRLTRFGNILRSSSLDELPSLVNVIKGEMSLVGPRPLPIEYLDLYSLKHKRRFEVKPGITGLAQINGRNNLSWQEKFDLDVEYVENASLRLDITILLKSCLVVLKRVGINAPGHATMPDFKSPGENQIN